MNLRKKFNMFYKEHIIVSWILSYLIIFIIPFVNTIYTYAKTENEIKQRLYRSDMRMLETVISTFDKSVSDFSTLAASVQSNDAVSELMASTDSHGSDFDMNCINAARGLRLLSTYSSITDGIYVYFPATDFCVGKAYNAKAESFFEYTYPNSDISADARRSRLSGISYASYIVQQTDEGTRTDFLFSLPLGSDHVKATAVISITNSVFEEVISQYADTQDRNVFIMDRDGQLVFGATRGLDAEYDSIPDGISFDKKTKSMIISCTSALNKWKYVSVTPQEFISGQLNYLRLPIILSIVFSALVVCLLILYFTRKNYAPLENIISVARKNLAQSDSPKSEYELIDDILNDYLTNKQQLHSMRHSEHSHRKNELLSRLAGGDNVDARELAELGISFISEYFAVVCFNITNASHLFASGDSDEQPDNDETAKLIEFIMSNVFEEIIGRTARGYVADADGKLILIISFDESRLSCWYDDVLHATAEARQFIEDNFKFSFTAGVSGIHKGLSSVASAYWEANHTLSYRSVIRNEELVGFENIRDSAAPGFFNDEIYQRLISFVKLGNYETAQSIADNIFSSGQVDVNFAHTVTLRIAADISTAISEVHDTAAADYSSFLRATDELIVSCSDYTAYREKLGRLLKLSCKIMEQWLAKQQQISAEETAEPVDMLTQNVKDYIRRCYSDSNLHLVSLGEHFDITPYYLSNIFKKKEGVALLDYIARLRIEKAKEYIDSSDIPMSDIAEKVGFNNVRTFLRTFKKFEGITPSQYKEMRTKK